jgi:AraC-like DNA-binding protein
MSLPPRRVYAMTLKKVRTFMKAHGFDDVVLLASTELRISDLDDPYRLISEEQARAFYRNVVDLTDDPGIGLEIGWMTSITEKGPLGLMQIAARTVLDAVEEGWASRDTYDGLIGWTYVISGDTLIHHISCNEEYEPLRIFLLERALGTFQAHAEELMDSKAKPTKVLVDYKAPRHIKRYKEIFRCPVYFEQKTVEIHYPLSYHYQEMASHDPLAHGVLEVLQASLLKKMSAEKDIVNEVKMALRRKSGEFPHLERIANSLAMSPRTLRRKLGAEGVHFQDLLDAERRKVAEDYLANSNLTIQQIAEECGFSDAQNFSQAFKRWTGMSPTEYRSSHTE